MSSTELPRRLAAEIEEVFAALGAAAAAARERGAPAMPLAPDEALVSYYVPTPPLPPFEELPAERAADWLAEHWTSQGWPELAALVPRLVALARALAEEQRAQPLADVSGLIYQMF